MVSTVGTLVIAKNRSDLFQNTEKNKVTIYMYMK